MLKRILVTALAAGLGAGVFVSLVQMMGVHPLIIEAETYEAVAPAEAAAAQSKNGESGENGANGMPSWAPGDGIERTSYTVLANMLTGFGFALLLSAALALHGRPVDWRRGLVWGLAGFAVFGLAPALGLPPEPPGVEAAPLAERQLWWLGTAAATALGLGLIAFAPRRLLKAVGAIVLILPHAVGAPELEAHGGAVPQDLVQAFWVASLAATALFWLVLGGLAGFLYPRLA